MTEYVPSHVHFVGSIGLNNVEEVFTTVGPLLGRRPVVGGAAADRVS